MIPSSTGGGGVASEDPSAWSSSRHLTDTLDGLVSVISGRTGYASDKVWRRSLEWEVAHARHVLRDHGEHPQFAAEEGVSCPYCEAKKED